MKSIDDILAEFNIDKNELETLIRENSKIAAIKIVYDKTGMGLKNAKDLIEHLSNKEPNITKEYSYDINNFSVRMINKNRKITVKLKEGNRSERTIFPSDPQWEKVKKALGNPLELTNFEKDFSENPSSYQQQKSTLFVENNNSKKWIYLFLAALLAVIVYYFFLKS